MGAGTVAFFSDTETSSRNTIEAGTLDLDLDPQDDGQTATFLDVSAIEPGSSGSEGLDIANAGSLDGVLRIELVDIESEDRNGSEPGDLESFLRVQASMADEIVLGEQPVSELDTGTLLETSENSVISATDQQPFTVDWWLPDATDNSAQGDSLTLKFRFRLDQIGGG